MKAILKSVTLLILVSSNVYAADEYTGKEKAETCLGCHAIEGYNNTYPTYKVPKLGGQHADYIVLRSKLIKKVIANMKQCMLTHLDYLMKISKI